MRTLKKHTSILILLTLLVGFTSCEEDEDIFDKIVGRTWVGDLGFYDGDYALESDIKFGSDGFGVDEQWYYDYDTDRPVATLNVRWWIKDGNMFLDYGNDYPLLVLEALVVDGRYMTGRLYADDVDQGTVTLEMVD